MKDIDAKICLQVKVPVIEIAMMGLAEVTTWQVAVAFQFQTFDVHVFLSVFWNRRRQCTRIEVPSDECFLCLLLPVGFRVMDGDGMSASPMVIEGL